MSDDQDMTGSAGRNATLRGSDVSFHALDLPPLPPDLKIGMADIAKGLIGTDDPKAIRSLYNIFENSSSLPHAKWGSRVCVRLSSVRAKLWSQERRSWTEREEPLVKTHILLTSMLPLLIKGYGNELTEREKAQLTNAVAEAVKVIKELLHA